MKKIVYFLSMFIFCQFASYGQDPNVSVYVANPQYVSNNIFRFDLMVQAVGATSSFSLRTFQAGIYVNPSWLNGGTLFVQNVATDMVSPGYNGSIMWNTTDKLLNLSVNTGVRSVSGCVSTVTGTTPLRVATIELSNTTAFSSCATPDLKFNYVQSVSPLRLRTSVSWRSGTGCNTNYDLYYPNRTYSGQMYFNGELYSGTDADGKSPSSVSANLAFCYSTLNLRAFIQGYYTGGNTMQSVMMNSGVARSTINQVDTIQVEFRSSSNPSVIVGSDKTVLNVNGGALVSFANSLAGQFVYVVIKHRNSVETWSAGPVQLSAGVSYDFSSSSSKAFANNMFEVEPGVWALFTGDLNQDGFIDASDYPSYDSDNNSGVLFEYVPTDLNGDGYVDASDYPLFDVNNNNGVMAFYP